MGDRSEYQVEQIILRAKKIRRQRESHLFMGLSAISFLLAVSLIGTIGATIDYRQCGEVVLGNYGAVLLHRVGDAYVLTGIIAFVMGVIITAICINVHGKQQRNELTRQKYEEKIK